MTMTMQRVDDRHKLSLPLFYPHYKPGYLKSRSSKDVQFLEASPRSSRSSQSSRQHSEPNPNRSTETSLKSCLRKSSEKHSNNKDADIHAKSGHLKETDSDRRQVGCFKHTDCDVHLYATTGDNESRFPTKKWRATKVDTSCDDSKENREHVKMKGCGYTRFRYPLRFHYGSSVHQPRSGVISAIPAGLRTSSFYSNLPRRQKLVLPGSLSNGKNGKGKDGKQRREKEQSPAGEKTAVENDRNSRAASPERELNGVYHVVHEAEPAQEHDSKVEKKHGSRTTRGDRYRPTKNQPDDDDDDDDDEVSEVKDNDETESSRRSSRSSQPDRSEESIKEAGSSSEKEKSKNVDSSSNEDDDDVDLRRNRKVEKRKNKKKRKKDIGRDEIETEYAADFDDEKSETFSRD